MERKSNLGVMSALLAIGAIGSIAPTGPYAIEAWPEADPFPFYLPGPGQQGMRKVGNKDRTKAKAARKARHATRRAKK